MTATTITRGQVRPGDTLVDALGRPYFRVTEVHQARARGYVVFFGTRLLGGDGQEGGHRAGTVVVAR